MALEVVDKMKIGKYIKNTPVDSICWGGFFDNVRKDKYTEYDVLVFLIDSFIKKLDGNDYPNEKILVKYIISIGYFFWWSKENCEPDIEIISKIRVFEEKYLKYIERTNQKKSDNVITLINTLIKEIDENLGIEDSTSEEVSKYVASIIEMENKVKELTLELEEARKKIASYEKEKNESLKKSKKNADVLSELRDKVKRYEKIIKGLEKEIEVLKNRANCTQEDYDSLLEKYKAAQEKIDSLTVDFEGLKRLYDAQEVKISEYENHIRQNGKEMEESKSRLSFEKELDDKITILLFSGMFTVDQIVEKLQSDGSVYSVNDVRESLARIELKINISKQKEISFPREYGVCAPSVTTHSKFNLKAESDVLDIMVISDLHLQQMDYRVDRRLNALYDYCTKHGINYILNLGDLFNLTYDSKVTMETYTSHQKLIDEIVDKFPKDDKIVHFVLGGNHDRNAASLGFDSIEALSKRRDDFVSLGYSHSLLSISGSTKNEFIGLHHPNGWVVDDLDDFGSGATKIKSYLSQSCAGIPKNYIELFGHFHASRIDTINGIASVPSLFYDKERSGAWHIKVYLDKEKNIKHIVFIQLLADRELTKVSEVGYQKVIK